MTKDNRTGEVILRAAAELFYEQGYDATTIRQIQDRANNGSIHYYFRKKKDIAVEMFERYLVCLDKVLAGCEDEATDRRDPLLLLMVRSVLFLEVLFGDERYARFYFQSFADCKHEYSEILLSSKEDVVEQIVRSCVANPPSHKYMKCYDLITLSAAEDLLHASRAGNLDLSLDEIIEIHTKLGPKLFGVDDAVIDAAYQRAREVASLLLLRCEGVFDPEELLR